MKFNEELTAQCRYHFGHDSPDCRWVRLRHRPGSSEWQEPIEVCGPCRDYLKGYFKYLTTEELSRC